MQNVTSRYSFSDSAALGMPISTKSIWNDFVPILRELISFRSQVVLNQRVIPQQHHQNSEKKSGETCTNNSQF